MTKQKAIQKFLTSVNITANRKVLAETLSTNTMENMDREDMYGMGHKDGQTEFAKEMLKLWEFFQGNITK